MAIKCRDGGIRPIWELVNLPLFVRVKRKKKKKVFLTQRDINVGRNRNCLEGPETDFKCKIRSGGIGPDPKFTEVSG